MTQPYHEYVKMLYTSSKSVIDDIIERGIKNDQELDINVWMQAITIFIINVEGYKQLTGTVKKRIVLEVCLLCVDKIDRLNSQNKFQIKTLIKTTIPSIIDYVVRVGNELNKSKSRIAKFFGKIFKCLCSQPEKIPEPIGDIIIDEPVSNVAGDDIIEPIPEEEQPAN